ncbi:MAG: PKD domain-containing protein [Chthoniobacteraceae bacterium]
MNKKRLFLLLTACVLLAVGFIVHLVSGEKVPSAGRKQTSTETGEAIDANAARAAHSSGVADQPAGRITGKAARFSDFRAWYQRYATAPDRSDATLLAEGVRLARARRAVMEELIAPDPEAALEEAVTLDVYAALPAAIREETEEPFSALIDVTVLPVCRIGSADLPLRTESRIETRFTDGDVLRSAVFGRRLELDTKERTPVQGIRLGENAALRPAVFHPLQPGEIAIAEAKFPLANLRADRDFLSGESLGPAPVVAVSGGRIFKFSSRESLAEAEKSLAALDRRPGPHSGSGVMFLPMPADPQTGVFNLGEAVMNTSMASSAWTETKKKVFFIRVDFSNVPGAPVSDTALASTLNTPVSNAILEMSYGKTWIEGTVSSQVTRMPNAATFYTPVDGSGSSNNDQLHTDAKAKYLADNPGFDFAQYDIIGVFFAGIGMKGSGLTYAGLAGGTRMWLQNNSSTDVIVHEFGHNYGLGHSSFWVRSDGSTNPVDPSGASEEYGDRFDTMGSGPTPEGHFHMEAKQRLNWLAAADWIDATAGGSGTYRIYRIDDAGTTGARGLRVTKAADSYYWIGYRRRIPANNYLPQGAYVVWKLPGQNRSWNLDLTPNSNPGTNDRDDGSLPIGKTYGDTAANIFVTPIARGGTAPNQYLDVRINSGPFPGNAAPVATINGPSTIDARKTAVFSANASDSNGDTLAYFWDFGGAFSTDNNATVPFAWTIGGSYTVTLTVSDMKGGTVTATKSVTVVDPLNTWTQRANTAAGDFNGIAASSTRAVAVGELYAGAFKGPWAWSADGVTWTSGLFSSNEQMSDVAWDGTQFVAVGQRYDFGVSNFVGVIKTSTDGSTWTERYFAGAPLNAVTAGGGVNVAVSKGGAILRSTGGVTWSTATSGTTYDLTDVTWGNGIFVAVGRQNQSMSGNAIILTSPDGLTWTNRIAGAPYLSTVNGPNGADFTRTGFGAGRFCASGWYSLIGVSSDQGVTWTQGLPAIPRYELKAFAYGNGIQFAAGIDRSNLGADANLVYADGATWSALPTAAQDDRNGAVFFNNSFITVGDNHSIWQSNAFQAGSFGFVQWRDAKFPEHNAGSQPGDDFDFDGLQTLLEYALQREPKIGAAADGTDALPDPVTNSIDPLLAGRLALRLDVPEPAPGDLTYVVEVTGDLTSGSWTPLATKSGTGAWAWNPGGTARIVLGAPFAGRRTVHVGDTQTISGGPRFMRLRTFITP